MRLVVLNLATAVMCGLPAGAACAASGEDVLEEVTVTATLREQALSKAPASVSVLDQQTVRDAGRQHFEDVLTSVPNLHWAGGASRPRYFQLRGIGELEQYEGAPNPSVGFLIDDIDFSGVAMAATTFDVERIEVLRGPQGMRYGANSLAGLIVLRGTAPEDEFGVSTEAAVGDYDSESLGVVATGPISKLDSAWRVAVQRYRTDGFRENAFLQRNDTNDRDELTARAKWRWRPMEGGAVDFTWLYADLDNGYDAWSIDNSRVSLADRPGKDAQRANGASIRATLPIRSSAELTLIAAGANTDAENSFDGDWGNAQSWAPYTYDYFYRALSARQTRSFETRLASAAPAAAGEFGWLLGAYTLDLHE
ncbi:MAG TPA: TonB-dependent receptor plug domain-containing protein, partial [Steroidobacter sp.]|nr:TonB-dependent receptor plug domain-containing protein [Steroidobacter sp.]